MSIFMPIRKDYEIMQTIGTGAFGKVKLGEHRESGRAVAIKIMLKKNMSPGLEACVRQEIRALTELKHPNICAMDTIIETSKAFFLILEYVAGGDFLDFIISQGHISEEEARPMFLQMSMAMAYTHGMGYAHRDLKPENILITEDKVIKLIDFGLCAHPKDGMKSLLNTRCGNLGYSAPEVLMGGPYLGAEADSWSMGMLLYVMLVGKMPFETGLNIHHLRHIISTDQIPYPPSTTDEAKHLISRLMNVDPENRLSMKDVMDHPWMKATSEASSLNHEQQNPRDIISSRAHNVPDKNLLPADAVPNLLDSNNNVHFSVSDGGLDNNTSRIQHADTDDCDFYSAASHLSSSGRVSSEIRSSGQDFSGNGYWSAASNLSSCEVPHRNASELDQDISISYSILDNTGRILDPNRSETDEFRNNVSGYSVSRNSTSDRVRFAERSTVHDFLDSDRESFLDISASLRSTSEVRGCPESKSPSVNRQNKTTPTWSDTIVEQTTETEDIEDAHTSCVPNFTTLVGMLGRRVNRLRCILPSRSARRAPDAVRTVKNSRKLRNITPRSCDDLLYELKESIIKHYVPCQQSGYTMTCSNIYGDKEVVFQLEVVNVVLFKVVKAAILTKIISGSKSSYKAMRDELLMGLW